MVSSQEVISGVDIDRRESVLVHFWLLSLLSLFRKKVHSSMMRPGQTAKIQVHVLKVHESNVQKPKSLSSSTSFMYLFAFYQSSRLNWE